jgi:hypothetical protein
MHRIAETEPFIHTAPEDQFFNCGSDIDKASAALDFEPEMFGERFHCDRLPPARGILQGFEDLHFIRFPSQRPFQIRRSHGQVW